MKKDKKYLKKIVSAFTVCMMIPSMVSAPVLVSRASDNIISNSTFESGTSGWGIYKESGGNATLSTDEGRLAMHITSVGKLNYAVQMYYDIVPLYKNGVYHISYEISSDTDRSVEAMIQQNGGKYTAYTWKNLDLTSEPQKVDYTFTMEYDSDIMSKFVFNCGKQEGIELGEHTIYLDNVVIELVDDSEVDYSEFRAYEPSIVTNQIGYAPNAKKTAVFKNIPEFVQYVGIDEKEFSVVNADTEEVVYDGILSIKNNSQNLKADEFDCIGDFSEVKEVGKYYIKCEGLDDSYTFEIGENVYSNLIDDSVRMLYLQRCGTDIEDEVFGHKACHNTEATIYGTKDKIDVSGGWHDAGDYGRYIVPAAKSVADLLYAYDANPEIYSDNIGIPESNNGVPDILDEVRYELEWMLKMQSETGGVYHKVSCENFPGYVMPEMEKNELIVTPVSTTATADFCASMAMAYEFYLDIDKDFAETCLEAAKRAWTFLEENPQIIFKDPEDITTGAYQDTVDKDERYWASAQMYRATGEEKYLTAFESYSYQSGLDWSTVGDYGNIAILTMKNIDKNSELYKNVETKFLKRADDFSKATYYNPYNVAISKYNWGSNMTIANAGVVLGLAGQLTDNPEYIESAKSNLNYLLGNNPNGVCYVTGFGTVSPQNPHHRPSMAKNQAMKGMLVGGVNSGLEDSAAKAYLAGVPAAKCYVDHSESYSTNEITIYWNSPLIYLLSFTENTGNISVENLKGDANEDGLIDVADVVAVASYVGDSNSNPLSEQGIINSDVHSTGNGITADDALTIQQYLAKIITEF